MKKIILITLFSFVGCNVNNPLVDIKGISKIIICYNPTSIENSSKIEINKASEIEKICTIINEGKREPLKFIPDYRIEIHYAKVGKVVLVKENYININGLTYELNENLNKELSFIK